MKNKINSRFGRSGVLTTAAATAVLLAVMPATAANASYWHDLGGGSCATSSAFIRSHSTGYVAHYRNNVLLASWNGGILAATRQSQMAPTWSSAHVTGQDGGVAPKATLYWAFTGCGRL